MRKVHRRRPGPELATLQSLNNCNVEPRATRAYGDLRTKICERTFFLRVRVRVKEARTIAGQKVRTNRPFATEHIPDKQWPSSQRSNLSLEAILVSSRFPGISTILRFSSPKNRDLISRILHETSVGFLTYNESKRNNTPRSPLAKKWGRKDLFELISSDGRVEDNSKCKHVNTSS